MATPPRRGLSLCSGGGGLDLGLGLAEPGFHTVCYVEWDEYPRQCLVAAQQAGYLAPAPIWSDLCTFDARPWRGIVDTVLAGYPCQPFSQAGQRRGADDERHLWPHVARVVLEARPRWVFLENVAGHVSLGAETVLRELRDMGWTPAAGLFSAEEVGAPHERLRWFCVAHRRGDGRGERRPAHDHDRRDASGHDPDGRDPELADPDGGHPGAARKQRGRKQRLQPEGDGDGARPVGDALGEPAELRRGSGQLRGAEPEARGEGHPAAGRQSRAGRPELADPERHGPQGRTGAGPQAAGRRRPAHGDQQMADACEPRPQGREQRRAPRERDRAPAPRPAAERGTLPLFPPGPGDRDAWAALLAADPARAPALARRDAKAAALRLAAMVPPEAAEAILERAGDMEIADLLRAMDEETGGMVEHAEALASFRDIADGLAARPRALRLLGNGVVPLAAAHAWRSLSAAHGRRPVDLEAPDPDDET